MTKKIFISYRRADSQHAVDRIVAELRKHLPRKNVFLDVDNIPPGVDFADYLDEKVAECDVLLAVIGPFWLNVDNAHATQIIEPGQAHFDRRLDDPEDFVRVEIASALKRGIPVVPVILDGAGMPSRAELPEDLQGLARRNAAEIRRKSFETDVKSLVKGLGVKSGGAAAPVALVAAIGAVVMAAAGYWFINRAPVSSPAEATPLSQAELDQLWSEGSDAYQRGDAARAFRAWTRACNLGQTSACGDLGVMYENGEGTEIDLIRAVDLYRKACEAGRGQHCTNLASAFGEGRGVGKDLVRARDLYDKACRLGHQTGCASFGYYLARGWGGEVDKIKGWGLVEAACEAGDAHGCSLISAVEKSGSAPDVY